MVISHLRELYRSLLTGLKLYMLSDILSKHTPTLSTESETTWKCHLIGIQLSENAQTSIAPQITAFGAFELWWPLFPHFLD